MMEKPATDAIDRIVDALHRITRHPWRIMEICGGQTHAIARYGIEKLLPPQITLIHGPGCPVCVTPETTVEKAMQIAGRSDVVFTTFGDMLRVPGISGDLLSLKSRGADIRMLYSPLDALPIAKALPGKEVVFLAVGFETTVPVYASAILSAQQQKITNFSLLTSLYTVPPAIEAIMADDECRIDGLLAAGHVCTVEGYDRYEELARRLGVSISVTGFTPVELLLGIYHDIRLLENGEHDVYNAYPAAVSRHGNRKAKEAVEEVFQPCDQTWRGIGRLPASGLQIKKRYEHFDALKCFPVGEVFPDRKSECRAGDVLKGKTTPAHCPAFGRRCTPEHPLGALMVSSEGACAAYYRYRR